MAESTPTQTTSESISSPDDAVILANGGQQIRVNHYTDGCVHIGVLYEGRGALDPDYSLGFTLSPDAITQLQAALICTPSNECPTCKGTGRAWVHDAAGAYGTTCPGCDGTGVGA